MNFPGARSLCLLLALTLTACAAVRHSPARLQPPALSGQPTARVLAQETRITLDKGEVKDVRPKVSTGLMPGHIVPEPVGPDEAQKELATLSHTGGAQAG